MNVEHLAAGFAPPAGTRRPAEAEGRAWQLQLQRAQSAGWFVRADGLLSRQVLSDETSVRASERPAPGNRKPAARMALTTAPAPASASDAPGTAGGPRLTCGPYALARVQADGGAGDATRTVTPGIAGTEMHPTGVAPEDLDSSEEQRPIPRPALARRDLRAPRIHIEEGMNGLNVWLGLDGSANELAARVGAVVADLRRQCERSGVRLAQVTCNGVPLQTRKEP